MNGLKAGDKVRRLSMSGEYEVSRPDCGNGWVEVFSLVPGGDGLAIYRLVHESDIVKQ